MSPATEPGRDGRIRVETVAAAATFELRRSVLRPNETVDEQALPDDDREPTATFAVRDDAGAVIGSGRVARAPSPSVLGDRRPSWQLRAMAVAPEHRGAGIGSAIVARIVDHVARHGGGLLWCNARLPARSLYERAGMAEIGGVFSHVGVDHVVMWREVDAAP